MNGKRQNTNDSLEMESIEFLSINEPPKDDNKKVSPERKHSGWLNTKQLVILLAIYITFITLGGIIFHFIEHPNTQRTRVQAKARTSAFLANKTCLNREELLDIVALFIDAHEQGISLSYYNSTDSDHSSWNIIGSIFFSTTIVTTIGYGNITPNTAFGKTFAVIYAMIGIPLFLITSGQLGMRLYCISEKLTAKIESKFNQKKWKSTIAFLLVFVIGFVIFSLGAALVFTAVEGWSYAESIYYTFITLTTIGFGDYYPAYAGGSKDTTGSFFYKLFVSLWIVLGLVWMATILSAISKLFGKLLTKKITDETNTGAVAVSEQLLDEQ